MGTGGGAPEDDSKGGGASESKELAYAEDLKLAQAAAGGDKRACEAFVRRLLPTVRRVSNGLLRGSEDAKDAAQISLIDLLGSASNYAGRGPLEAWAQRIATRSTLRWINKQRRVRERVRAQAQISIVQDRQATLQTETLDRLPRPLDDYLAQLSAVQRTAVLLRLAIGHTIPEIASITETPIPTVKSRIQKGHKELCRLVRRDLNLGVKRDERDDSE